MDNLSSSQRSKLKSYAHHLKPVLIIGKNGLSDGALKSLNKSLDAHELIKVKFIDCKDEKDSLIVKILKSTNSILIGTIGHVAILFKKNPDPNMQNYQF